MLPLKISLHLQFLGETQEHNDDANNDVKEETSNAKPNEEKMDEIDILAILFSCGTLLIDGGALLKRIPLRVITILFRSEKRH